MPAEARAASGCRALTARRGAGGVPALLGALALALAGCTSVAPPRGEATPAAGEASPLESARAAPAQAPAPEARGQVLARNARLLVYLPAAGDTLAGIAARFLGRGEESWQIAEANGLDELDRLDRRAGAGAARAARAANAGSADREGGAALPAQPLLVPLQPLNPLGVHADRLQLVPVLCYHRLGGKASKMSVTPAAFEAQMAWLVANGYRVVRLAELGEFLAGRKPLPRRSVVLTFDDGYASFHRYAYPVLAKYGLPATLFVYTDFVGARDALSWAQLQEMQASGLVDVQSHTRSHRNLVERLPGESPTRYLAALEAEMRSSRELLQKQLGGHEVRHLAYPFGDADMQVIESARRNGYELAATVVPGGNAFYAAPMMLRRTMIFGDTGLEAFKTRVQVERELDRP